MGEPPFRPAPGEVEGARQVQEEGGEERELQAVRSPSADGRHGDEGGVCENTRGSPKIKSLAIPPPAATRTPPRRARKRAFPRLPPARPRATPARRSSPHTEQGLHEVLNRFGLGAEEPHPDRLTRRGADPRGHPEARSLETGEDGLGGLPLRE